MRYKVLYKCGLCNKTLIAGVIDIDNTEMSVNKMIALQTATSNPYLGIPNIHLSHACSNTKCGLAIFIGFEQV